jgi:hypothetical protein
MQPRPIPLRAVLHMLDKEWITETSLATMLRCPRGMVPRKLYELAGDRWGVLFVRGFHGHGPRRYTAYNVERLRSDKQYELNVERRRATMKPWKEQRSVAVILRRKLGHYYYNRWMPWHRAAATIRCPQQSLIKRLNALFTGSLLVAKEKRSGEKFVAVLPPNPWEANFRTYLHLRSLLRKRRGHWLVRDASISPTFPPSWIPVTP